MTANEKCKMSNNPIIKKERNSNIELYRIIVMLMIVAHHYVVNGSGLADIMSENPYDANTIFYRIFGAWGKTGINCFVLITGYFMCKSNITLTKFLKLFSQVLCYGIVLFCILCLSGYTSFTLKRLVIACFPIYAVKQDFTSAFLLVYLFIPFLNVFINSINKKMHLYIIGLMLLIYTVMPMMLFPVSYNYVSWFIALYLISSYIRFYGLPYNDSAKKWGLITLTIYLVSILSIVSPLIVNRQCTYFFVSDSNHIFALLLSVSSFMFFKNIQIRHNRVINTIASTTFGIFLIHTHSNGMRVLIWNRIFDSPGHYSTPLYAVFAVMILFVVCSLIDLIRQITIEKPILNALEYICRCFYNRINLVSEKIRK